MRRTFEMKTKLKYEDGTRVMNHCFEERTKDLKENATNVPVLFGASTLPFLFCTNCFTRNPSFPPVFLDRLEPTKNPEVQKNWLKDIDRNSALCTVPLNLRYEQCVSISGSAIVGAF